MKQTPRFLITALPALLLVTASGVFFAAGYDAGIDRQAGSEMRVTAAAPAGTWHRLDTSDDLQTWMPLATVQSNGTAAYTDGGAPYAPRRNYRFTELTGPAPLSGEHLQTDDGLITFHPVNHASFVMQWKDKMIYSDPVGGAGLYAAFPRADVIVVTHSHSDHWVSGTVDAVRNGSNVRIFAPQAVFSAMSATLRGLTTVILTGQTNPANNTPPQSFLDITVEGIPAYNANHPLGTANAYVLNMGGRRIFISGDTGNTAEMRALTNIDAAFVCMNVPFTMTIPDAVNAVRSFRPRVCYPYHFRNSGGALADVAGFKNQVGSDLGIEVRLRTWY